MPHAELAPITARPGREALLPLMKHQSNAVAVSSSSIGSRRSIH
jgi:hypothetical protein